MEGKKFYGLGMGDQVVGGQAGFQPKTTQASETLGRGQHGRPGSLVSPAPLQN